MITVFSVFTIPKSCATAAYFLIDELRDLPDPLLIITHESK